MIGAAIGIAAFLGIEYFASQTKPEENTANFSNPSIQYPLERNPATEYLADTAGNRDGLVSKTEFSDLEKTLNRGNGTAWIDPYEGSGRALFSFPKDWQKRIADDYARGIMCRCLFLELDGANSHGEIVRQFRARPNGSDMEEVYGNDMMLPRINYEKVMLERQQRQY